MNNAVQQDNSEIKMMGEHLAVTLTEEELSQVSGGRWFTTWCPSEGGECMDSRWFD